MNITVGFFLGLVTIAFICEYIDSAFGMGYGTILSPVLLIFGFNPLVAVPAILLSQAFGGLAAAFFHHKFENVSFHRGSRDIKIFFMISMFGVLATIFAVLIAISLPKIVLKTYISVLVLVMGIIILSNRKFNFSWKKMMFVGMLSSFNKGISGGGFGPVVTAGQIMAGQKHKNAIGVTVLAEVPICLVSFFTYLISRTITEVKTPVWNMPVDKFISVMFSKEMFQWELMLALLLGSVLVAPFGTFTTKILDEKYMHIILGLLIIMLGLVSLFKTYF